MSEPDVPLLGFPDEGYVNDIYVCRVGRHRVAHVRFKRWLQGPQYEVQMFARGILSDRRKADDLLHVAAILHQLLHGSMSHAERIKRSSAVRKKFVHDKYQAIIDGNHQR